MSADAARDTITSRRATVEAIAAVEAVAAVEAIAAVAVSTTLVAATPVIRAVYPGLKVLSDLRASPVPQVLWVPRVR